MAAYSMPTAAYTARTNELAQGKGMQDASRAYSKYISQERFRRGREDMGIDFKRNMPRLGSSFNKRGMWNSGLRKGGQKQFAGDYQRNVGRVNWDQGQNDQRYVLEQAQADAAYQSALQQAYDEFQNSRMAENPFDKAQII